MTADLGSLTRRALLHRTAIAAAAALVPGPLLGAIGRNARSRIIAREPWGTLEEVGPGVWAMLSTPLVDRTTLCNGGLVAGRDGVLMIEAFGSDAGARWMSDQALALTGRRPSHVVVTHFHADHTAGVSAATEHGAALLLTSRTRDLVLDRNTNVPRALLAGAITIDSSRASLLDLGGRWVTFRPLDGHTGSDVAIAVDDGATLFAGDLVWYEMFPNFVDATPSRLNASVRALRMHAPRIVIPGHGTRTDTQGLDRYLSVLDAVESAARAARANGISAEEAGRAFRMPAGTADWTLFNARYYERAIGAWMRELDQAP